MGHQRWILFFLVHTHTHTHTYIIIITPNPHTYVFMITRAPLLTYIHAHIITRAHVALEQTQMHHTPKRGQFPIIPCSCAAILLLLATVKYFWAPSRQPRWPLPLLRGGGASSGTRSERCPTKTPRSCACHSLARVRAVRANNNEQ